MADSLEDFIKLLRTAISSAQGRVDARIDARRRNVQRRMQLDGSGKVDLAQWSLDVVLPGANGQGSQRLRLPFATLIPMRSAHIETASFQFWAHAAPAPHEPRAVHDEPLRIHIGAETTRAGTKFAFTVQVDGNGAVRILVDDRVLENFPPEARA